MTPLTAALAAIVRDDASFADLLVQLHGSHYTGSLILHCVDGIPRLAEFPSRQVHLQSSRLDKPLRRDDPPQV